MKCRVEADENSALLARFFNELDGTGGARGGGGNGFNLREASKCRFRTDRLITTDEERTSLIFFKADFQLQIVRIILSE